jgi:hypothetical protein
MLDVILAWARFDTFISKWISVAFGTSPDATVILMGNMDTRNKLERLKSLYAHFGFTSEADRIEALKKAHAEHVNVRNTIAHVSCVGQVAGEPDKVVFTAVRRVKNQPGYTFVEVIHLEQMVAAVGFALRACEDIGNIVDELKTSIAERSQDA